jgi:subtilisin family serine protease
MTLFVSLVVVLSVGSIQLAGSALVPQPPHTYIVVLSSRVGTSLTASSMQLFSRLSEQGILVQVTRYFDSLGVGGVFNATDSQASQIRALLHPFLLIQSSAVGLGTSSVSSTEASFASSYFPGGSVNGDGVIVAVIDTGVNYTHPALGGKMGVRVIGGYNFVDSNSDIMDTDVDGHGTAVSGIIAGNATGFLGVAPGAKLLVYKVFVNGETTSDLIIQALDQAEKDGAKIVNLSLGGGFSAPALNSLGQLLYSKGIELVAAIGNDGPDQASGESPGDLPYFLGVGSSTSNATTSLQGEVVLGNGIPLTTAMALNDSPVTGGAISGLTTFIGNGKPSQVAGLNLIGRVAVALRDHQTLFAQMEQDAADAGAKALIVVNDAPESFTLNGTDAGGPALIWTNNTKYAPRIPTVAIGGAEGSSISTSAGDGTNASLAVYGSGSGLFPASFSSKGPADDFSIKPEITAPGDTVTFPDASTQGYARGSGTSFSTPQVTGALALLAQLHPDLKPEQAFSMISLGATVGRGAFGVFPLETQGAGVLNITKTLSLPFSMDLHYLLLFPSASHSYVQGLTVTFFTSPSPVTVSFSGAFPLAISTSSTSGLSVTVNVTALAGSFQGDYEDRLTVAAGGTNYTFPIRVLLGSLWLGYDNSTGQIYSGGTGQTSASLTILEPDGTEVHGSLTSSSNYSLSPTQTGYYRITASGAGGSVAGRLMLFVSSGSSSSSSFALEVLPSFVPLGVMVFSALVVFVALFIYILQARLVRSSGPQWEGGPRRTSASPSASNEAPPS